MTCGVMQDLTKAGGMPFQKIPIGPGKGEHLVRTYGSRETEEKKEKILETRVFVPMN